ncbi:SiaB family protein kinase [Paenibacillus thalictri]|uniref:Uncharacterized protein n=1 Tax=Paenibacillus thalictri TaxID=2527873 RepID=A0A4V2J4X2_9BACL|nr:SiaB family protein kinase [Paenibacillus thalictri]TBL81552.1 hypothetical protein EYB31_00625 [Paenibacillus thalictri]
MHNQLLELQTLLERQGLLICFSGKLTQGIIEELGEAVKQYMETENHLKSNVYDIFSIFVEQTQNIKNYCNTKLGGEFYEHVVHSSIVAIGKTDIGNYVCSGNRVCNSDVEQLQSLLLQIQPLNKAELKALYKSKIRQPQPEDSLGAGIGLIEIARKSTQPLKYTITGIDAQYSFFTLEAVV